jgi:hypothetical protein
MGNNVRNPILGPFATVGLMNIPFVTIFHPLVTWQGHTADVAMHVLTAHAVGMLYISASKGSVKPNRIRASASTASTSSTITAATKGAQVATNGRLLRLLPMGVADQILFVFVPCMLAIVLLGPDPTTIRRTSFGQPFGEDCEAIEASVIFCVCAVFWRRLKDVQRVSLGAFISVFAALAK